jgi:hypothetical protein
MVSMADLWLPVVLSGVFVFIVSSILHMCIPALHKRDYGSLPGESAILAAMRSQGVSQGSYRFPYAPTMKEMCTPEFTAKMQEGPVGTMTLWPNGPMKMGTSLLQWVIFCLVVCFITGYVTSLSTPAGTAYMDVFRRAGTVAILGFAFSSVPDSIWKGVSWKVTGKFVFDGLLYGLTAAGTFAWLWKDAPAAGG